MRNFFKLISGNITQPASNRMFSAMLNQEMLERFRQSRSADRHYRYSDGGENRALDLISFMIDQLPDEHMKECLHYFHAHAQTNLLHPTNQPELWLTSFHEHATDHAALAFMEKNEIGECIRLSVHDLSHGETGNRHPFVCSLAHFVRHKNHVTSDLGINAFFDGISGHLTVPKRTLELLDNAKQRPEKRPALLKARFDFI